MKKYIAPNVEVMLVPANDIMQGSGEPIEYETYVGDGHKATPGYWEGYLGF